MGLRKMFQDGAEFENLIEQSAQIKVSKVIHKAFIEVNEEGVIAAAGVASDYIVYCLESNVPKEFKVNHPFMFFIRDETNNFFQGKVTNLPCTMITCLC
jgi:serpin B